MAVKKDEKGEAAIVYVPDLLYAGGRFERDLGLACDGGGRVAALLPIDSLSESIGGEPRAGEVYDVEAEGQRFSARFVRLRGRALLPGMVNAHSHAFQRVIRGRTEYRRAGVRDSFWTWRELMYSAAERLTPEDLYDASRMAFLEMLASGITSVGEFHYLHGPPGGGDYDDPNLLARTVVRAARDAGLRIALLRVAYARSGYRAETNPRQSRFIESSVETYARRVESLIETLGAEEAAESGRGGAGEGGAELKSAWVGVAPHSVRALPLEWLRGVGEFAAGRGLPVHMHVAEQPAEISACVQEHGRTPLQLLQDEGLLCERFTAVHAVHVTSEEVRSLARAGASVCACPTTERNLGDGIVPADLMFEQGVRLALGTDSHAQIDLLEDARELEYHLRLRRLERNVLAPASGMTREEGGGADSTGDPQETSALAARLFECATAGGARSIGLAGGELARGRPADFFTVDLEDPSIAGADAEDLLPLVVFSLSRAAVRETAVAGRFLIQDGRHRSQQEIVTRFAALQRRLWNERHAPPE